MMLAITLAKALHIGGVILWGAGLLALPLMLAQHDPDDSQEDYAQVRRFSHYGYTHLLTPAAVIAVTAGGTLIFLRGVFTPWMFGKLVLVGGLVAVHAWIGTTVVRMGEEAEAEAPRPLLPMAACSALLVAILIVVLAKPVVQADLMPDWLRTPRDRHLPLDEVPI